MALSHLCSYKGLPTLLQSFPLFNPSSTVEKMTSKIQIGSCHNPCFKGVGSTWKYICMKKKNLELYLTSFIRIEILEIHHRYKHKSPNCNVYTWTFIHENKGENLCGVGLGNGFLGREQKHNHKRKIIKNNRTTEEGEENPMHFSVESHFHPVKDFQIQTKTGVKDPIKVVIKPAKFFLLIYLAEFVIRFWIFF